MQLIPLFRKIGAISNYSNKGKHTTTFAKLIDIDNGGFIVDTPGIRELGLFNIESWELSLFFPEMLNARKNANSIHALIYMNLVVQLLKPLKREKMMQDAIIHI